MKIQSVIGNQGLCRQAGKCLLLPQYHCWPNRFLLWSVHIELSQDGAQTDNLRRFWNCLDPTLMDSNEILRRRGHRLERNEYDFRKQVRRLYFRLFLKRSKQQHSARNGREVLSWPALERTAPKCLHQHVHGYEYPGSRVREMELQSSDGQLQQLYHHG